MEDVVAVDGELHVDQTDNAEVQRELRGGRLDLGEHLGPERHGREDARRVARVHAGLLDVLHDPADRHALAVAQRVDVDLDGVLEEAVEIDGSAA